MKRLLIFLAYALSVFLLGGCQSSSADRAGVKVIIEGDEQFPEFLVGIWRADRQGWEFVFEPDGTISSAVISLGRIRLKPAEVTTVPMKLGGKGTFEPDQWMVYYIPATRELTVKIALKRFNINVGSNIIEGAGTDIFIGPISQDGNLWQADWTSFPEYKAHTDVYSNFDLSVDPNYGITNTLTFEKVPAE
jgi:hypothetical protein